MMLTFANDIWGARCGKSARRVLLGETRSSGHAYSVRGARESVALRQAPHGLPSSRLVSTILFDLWVEAWRQKTKGEVIVVRYADDLVMGFEHRTEAEQFLETFRERIAKFGLELHPDKTRLIEFGRFAIQNRKQRGQGKPETFTFLGFTHYCGKRRSNGTFIVRRKTVRKRMVAKLRAIYAELRHRMHEPIAEVGAWVKKVVVGYYRYHAIPGNLDQLRVFGRRLRRLWHRVLCRRSQKGALPWDRAAPIFDRWIPVPRVLHPYPTQRFFAIHPR
jgi:nucleoid DNA-binding protein